MPANSEPASPETASSETRPAAAAEAAGAEAAAAEAAAAAAETRQAAETGQADGAVLRTVVLPKHLHARPAGKVAQAAARHPATTIELHNGHRKANARSVLGVMGLGAVTGTEVRVLTTGGDADAVADEIVEILCGPEEE